VFSRGREALKLFGPEIDLLLTDMRLPYLGGRELIEHLRDRRRTLKVLAFSGYPLNAPEGVPFLHKPFGGQELLRAVEEVLAPQP
jgi:CheY-like chemotaxis protein